MSAIRDVPGLDGSVREQVYAHVFSNADREVGGVLVGLMIPEKSTPFVTAAIAAIAASEQRSALTFTQDTWEHVHRVLERDHPDKQIVGWYHSHPGFGIFLSKDDVFIHRNFFSGAAQIALVVDPLHGTEGVFGWQGDNVVQWYERPTGRPGIGTSPLRLDAPVSAYAAGGAPQPTTVVLKSQQPPPGPARPRPALLLCALLVGILAGVGLWEGVLRAPAEPAKAPATIVQPAPGPSGAASPGATPQGPAIEDEGDGAPRGGAG